ncbi:NAD-dependent epimerase/dehydratase family protein [Mangrovibrevibacter kandeliae]|uniref:NAD-dependent epimerase/dehydratase family protein n=1 Tax=Mangrovibrevibacter kandeliae TaxID=2968473 RepID=UPI0021198E10|nr:NAD-dependent epimerase/dehydratase family protein [Aurantimonas sp. CSK15Z-1]MCQ8782978.1 NAD-dependent epimerase/dehydratase family protein [Aurantimonas sp. CSK15Z-1]
MAARYLITGGLGFIGRALCDDLLAAGYDVRVLDALIPQVHGDTRVAVDPRVEVIEGDVRDHEKVRQAIAGVDGVFHLAAEVGVGQSMYEIERYVSGNDVGTAVLLQELIDSPVRRIVVASSMSVYGEGLYLTSDGERVADARRVASRIREGAWEPVTQDGRLLEPVPTDESKPVDLASIYALTKYAQERAVQIFGTAYGVETVALRLFNVFGAGQALSNPYTGVLANFASRLMNGQAPTIFEDGQQRRDFVHVRDVARAFRLAMERPEAVGEVINIGSGRIYPISKVASLLAAAMGTPEIAPEILGKARSGDIRNCFADIGKARRLLGFEPQHALEDSLEEFVAWVRAEKAEDRGAEMRRHLEARGLVA